MTKKIVKRTDTNNETLYFYTHSDAVDVGEGSSTKSLTEVIDDTLHKSAQTLTNAEKTQVHANLGTESFVGDRAVRYDEAQVLGTSEKTQALTNLGLNGVDDVPTENSNNLVKSGGVQNELTLGAVYDVSAKKPTAGLNNDGKFESLSALLSDANLNTLIPTAVRKGGMSIKFIQSSDNKYVQYRYIETDATTAATFANVANWQGVDEKPIHGSKNLLESGGVADSLLESSFNCVLEGKGNQASLVTFKLPKGERFTLQLLNPDWNDSGLSQNISLKLDYKINGESNYTNCFNPVPVGSPRNDSYNFNTVECEHYRLVIRAVAGEKVYVRFHQHDRFKTGEVISNVNIVPDVGKGKDLVESDAILHLVEETSASIVGEKGLMLSFIEGRYFDPNTNSYSSITSAYHATDKVNIKGYDSIKVVGGTTIIENAPAISIIGNGSVVYTQTTNGDISLNDYQSYDTLFVVLNARVATETVSVTGYVNNSPIKRLDTKIEQKISDLTVLIPGKDVIPVNGSEKFVESGSLYKDFSNALIFSIKGNGSTITRTPIPLKVNTKYIVKFESIWTSVAPGSTKFQINCNNVKLKEYFGSSVIPQYVSFTTNSDSGNCEFLIRALATDYVRFRIYEYIPSVDSSVINGSTNAVSGGAVYGFVNKKTTALSQAIDEQMFDSYIVGNGNTAVVKQFRLVSGVKYRLWIINAPWNITGLSDNVGFRIRRYKNGSYTTICNYNVSQISTIPNSFDITGAECDYYELVVRAVANEKVYICISPYTEILYTDYQSGIINRKAEQMGNLKWTPKAQVIANEGTHPAGVEVIGIPYSSVKEYQKFVGIDVSIHTFMTAVNDVHSLLYTERVAAYNPNNPNHTRSAYGITYHGVNSISYYGNVCSAFVSTCEGYPIQFDSWNWLGYYFDKFETQNPQSVDNLRIGDVLWEPGHCSIVSNVFRNKYGKVTSVIISEQSAPIRRTKYTREAIQSRTSVNGATWCRIKDMSINMNYAPSPFVLLPDEYLYSLRDIVYIDSDNGRKFYSKINDPATPASFVPASWREISGYDPSATYIEGSICSSGERLYKSKIENNSQPLSDSSAWEVVKGLHEFEPYPYVYNNDIVSFAGDRAVFKNNDLIYINYQKGDYTQMEIYKDGTLIQTLDLSSDSSEYQINVSSYCSGAGMYRARLTDGTNKSRFTYFEVVDTSLSVVADNGNYELAFNSSNGEALEAKIVSISGYPMGRLELNVKDRRAGKVVINADALAAAQSRGVVGKSYENEELFAVITFAGEWGTAISKMISIGNHTTISGINVYPNQQTELGVLSNGTNILLAGRLPNNTFTFSFEAENDISINVLSTTDTLKWINALPASLESGKTYLVTISNGIGNVMSV